MKKPSRLEQELAEVRRQSEALRAERNRRAQRIQPQTIEEETLKRRFWKKLRGLIPLVLALLYPSVGAAQGLSLYTVDPCRWFDTREQTCVCRWPWYLPCAAGALSDGEARPYNAQEFAICGAERTVPLGAKAIVLIVIATEATGDGELTVYPGDMQPAPVIPSLAFKAGETRSIQAIVPLGQYQFQDPVTPFYPDLWVQARVDRGGAVHIVVDVYGYFMEEP